MADSITDRSNVFISYSHRDKDYLDRLHVFLKPWLQEKHIEVWDDTRLRPGDHWEAEIARALASARVAVLLVSPDFLASDFITQNELPPLLDAAEREGAVILPVILMPCLFRRTKLSQFQTVNDPAQPLSLMPSSERDVVWERLVEQMLDALTPAPQESAQPQAQPTPNDAPEAPKEPAPAPNIDSSKVPTEAKVSPIGTLLLTYREHFRDNLHTVAWSPDGTRIASGGNDQTVQVWDAKAGKKICAYTGHPKQVNALAWSPDGTRIVSGSGGGWFAGERKVQVWDAATGQHILTYEGHSDSVNSVAWSPDGKGITSGSSDKTVQVWEATTGIRLLSLEGHTASVVALAWSLDGTRIASGSDDGTVRIWDATTGQQLFTYEGHSGFYVSGVAWSPDGTRIASCGSSVKKVHVWDAKTGGLLFTLENHGAVYTIAWSPDGKRLASGSENYFVHIWDAVTGKLLFTYKDRTSKVRAVAWSPDSTRIASCGSGLYESNVQVWSAR